MKRNLIQQPEAVAGTSKPAAPDITDKSGYAKRWGGSRRWVDSLLQRGLPHLKIGARRVRIITAEADKWMCDTFGTRRMGGVR